MIRGHEDFEVYVDSPLAIEATHVFKENLLRCYDDETRELVEKGMFAREDYERIDSAVIGVFLRSELGQRMSRAQREGRLRREQQFVIGIPAREMGIADSEELVIIQGIIDAYLEEDGELVVIDYKTDKVRSARVLADHYRVQLDYYKRALEQMTGKRVKEKILYSLTLQQAIPV